MQTPTGDRGESDQPLPNWSQPLRKNPPGAGRRGPTWAGYAPSGSEADEEPEHPSRDAERYGSQAGGYSFRNLGQQFRTNPGVQQALQRAFDTHDRTQYFRRAGMGSAIRYTLGLPQNAEHLRHYMDRTNIQRNIGLDPQPISARLREPEQD